ncbi:MAG TPA: hypothetical protein VJB87_05275, partial [Candidatus Nanoarchaeia archaeon]|nr:hypothetical protein [Candidatus Nanoarchaeia archaeon]
TINETTYGSIEEDYTWSLTNNIWQRTQPTPEEENTQKKVETPIIESGLLIIKSPTQTSYGKTINITINITSTNEKELVTLAIPNITSTSITTYQPYTTLTLTLHLPENCEQQQAEGTHELSLNTNETITKKDILITHNKNCKKTTQSITTASAAKNNKTTYNISSIETLIKQEEKTSYQGTNNKLYTTSVYLFSILSLITIIYYWKKHGH